MLGDNDAAWDSAIFARFLEQYAAIRFKQTQAVFNWSKIIVLTQIVDEHTVVKFYRRRIPCTCLDKKYVEVKSITKMGICYNLQCNFLDRMVERSKTMYCSRCRCVTYCSREYQKAHWPMHKIQCDKFVDIIEEFEAKNSLMHSDS